VSEHALSYAYEYDSRRETYALASGRLVLVGAALTALVGVGLLWRRSRRLSRQNER
jgi:hypothetical protein